MVWNWMHEVKGFIVVIIFHYIAVLAFHSYIKYMRPLMCEKFKVDHSFKVIIS